MATDAFEALEGDEIPELPDVADLADGLVSDGSTPFESRDDKQVLNLIRSATSEDLTPTLKPLLPSWLQMTAVKLREDL